MEKLSHLLVQRCDQGIRVSTGNGWNMHRLKMTKIDNFRFQLFQNIDKIDTVVLIFQIIFF